MKGHVCLLITTTCPSGVHVDTTLSYMCDDYTVANEPFQHQCTSYTVEHHVVSKNVNDIISASVASAPTSLMAVQEGLTSIRVSWRPPTPLGDTTGYRISYSNDDSSDSVDVTGGSTDNHLLTGLQNGESYSVSVVATSEHFHSESVIVEEGLGKNYYYVCSQLYFEES